MHRVPAADGTLLAVHVFASVQDHRQLAAARDQRQLMLLHANGFSGRCYAELIAALRQQYTVYALDLRGHGASETGSLPFTALAVEDVLAVVDQLRLTSPVAVGHSIGGTLAARAEQLRPGLWSSLFLYEPVIGGSVEQVQSIAEGEMQGLARMAARRKRSFASSADALSRLGHRPGFSDLTAASLAAYVMHCFVTDAGGSGIHLRCDIEEQIFLTAGRLVQPTSAAMQSVRCPLTLICGGIAQRAADGIAAPLLELCTHALGMAHPASQVHVLQECGHLGPLTHPDLVAQIILAAVRDKGSRQDAAECPPTAFKQPHTLAASKL